MKTVIGHYTYILSLYYDKIKYNNIGANKKKETAFSCSLISLLNIAIVVIRPINIILYIFNNIIMPPTNFYPFIEYGIYIIVITKAFDLFIYYCCIVI